MKVSRWRRERMGEGGDRTREVLALLVVVLMLGAYRWFGGFGVLDVESSLPGAEPAEVVTVAAASNATAASGADPGAAPAAGSAPETPTPPLARPTTSTQAQGGARRVLRSAGDG